MQNRGPLFLCIHDRKRLCGPFVAHVGLISALQIHSMAYLLVILSRHGNKAIVVTSGSNNKSNVTLTQQTDRQTDRQSQTGGEVERDRESGEGGVRAAGGRWITGETRDRTAGLVMNAATRQSVRTPDLIPPTCLILSRLTPLSLSLSPSPALSVSTAVCLIFSLPQFAVYAACFRYFGNSLSAAQ